MAIPASEAFAGLHIELFHAKQICHGRLHGLSHEFHPFGFFFHKFFESRARIWQFCKFWVRHFELAITSAGTMTRAAFYILELLRAEILHDRFQLWQYDLFHVLLALGFRHFIPINDGIRRNYGVGDDEGVGFGKGAYGAGRRSQWYCGGEKGGGPKSDDGKESNAHWFEKN
jgi:hypothetical protein